MSNDDLIRRGDAIALFDAPNIIEDLRAIPAVQVGVKPLEWVDNPDASEGGMLGGGVTNSVYHAMSDGWSFHRAMFWRKTDNLEAAKAAAQADYEARILSALEPAPEVAALVEAAHGLSFGEDWNNGTAAKAHRNALLTAIAGIKGKNASPQAFAALSRIAPTNEVTPNDHNLQIRRASGRASDDPR